MCHALRDDVLVGQQRGRACQALGEHLRHERRGPVSVLVLQPSVRVCLVLEFEKASADELYTHAD